MGSMKEWTLYLLSVVVLVGLVVLYQVAGPYYEVGIAS